MVNINSYRVIDAHIHLDLYDYEEQERIIESLEESSVEGLVSVSFHLESCMKNFEISKRNPRIRSAFGFHPEQSLVSEAELDKLISFIRRNNRDMVAIGEVGLPYYTRMENPSLLIEPYIECLKSFIQLSSELRKPIVLHSVYDDAPVVCDLLERESVERAHFHWFKGDAKTIQRMQANGYYISVTPDLLYEKEIQKLVNSYPLSQMMVETDGPWRFEGPFTGKMTHPVFIHKVVEKISTIKRTPLREVYEQLYINTENFFKCTW
ncbi:TatD DNase family protein [Bacillus pakistanensis]|uniref:TatD DNase family protein n=1 Tax=Rossellomorea pakistanensis TaxID=992288 RepID=A0ABS2NEW5_9BACI|nr:TatD family hydrolase [Bacillus pakistanensis]MBM7586377.1 TatD DNase family protein [Bacillus pakistanensis]